MKYLLYIGVLATFFVCPFLPGTEFHTAFAQAPAQKIAPSDSAKATKTKPAPTTQTDYQLYLKNGHRSKDWDELIDPAFQSFDSGNLATAFVFLKRAYDRGCRDGLLLYRLGIYKESNKQYPEAADLLMQATDKIPKQYPGHPLVKAIHEHTGRALYLADDLDHALPELNKALESSPDNFMVLFMTGQISRLKKQFKEAKDLFERAMKVPLPEGADPETKQKLIKELMVVSFELGDLNATSNYADQILAKTPTDQVALSYKQKIVQMKQKQEEQELIKRIVK